MRLPFMKNKIEQKSVSIRGGRTVIPVTEIVGAESGPSVLITAGVHGGEYPGIAATMEMAAALTDIPICGKVTLIHAANPGAFWARRPEVNSEDNKNLNREFPGNPTGTATERLAWFLLNEYIRKADAYIDLHSGDIHEDLCPHTYYSIACEPDISKASKEMALVTDVPYFIPSRASGGAYNCAALYGVPSILIERGGNGICHTEDVENFKTDLFRILYRLGVLQDPKRPPLLTHGIDLPRVIYVLAETNCCWRTELSQGDRISAGDILGNTTNLFGTPLKTYTAESDGIILYINTSLALLSGKVAAAYAPLPSTK